MNMLRVVNVPTSAQHSLTIRVQIDRKPGMLGRVAATDADPVRTAT